MISVCVFFLKSSFGTSVHLLDLWFDVFRYLGKILGDYLFNYFKDYGLSLFYFNLDPSSQELLLRLPSGYKRSQIPLVSLCTSDGSWDARRSFPVSAVSSDVGLLCMLIQGGQVFLCSCLFHSATVVTRCLSWRRVGCPLALVHSSS